MKNFDNEIWKPVKGFECYYEVSNMGRVRSLDRTIVQSGRRSDFFHKYRGRVLKARVDPKNNTAYVVLYFQSRAYERLF